MKPFHLTILGSNAAGPAHGRITSCQVIKYDQDLFMIDCGEAAQIRVAQYKIKPSKFKVLLISHLHGDHIYGIPGLISSFGHNRRSDDLLIVGPVGIKRFVESLFEITQSNSPFPINYLELNHEVKSKIVFKDNGLEISAFPMKHRIRTFGYRFQEHLGERNIKKEAIAKHNLTIDEIKILKSGQNVTRNDKQTLLVEDTCMKQNHPRSYAYCSDTIFDLDLVDYVTDIDYLYHETTYTSDLEDQARERMHATAAQAATIALKSRARYLITGHYSSRYRHVDNVVNEAKSIFPNTIKGYDGLIIQIMPRNFKNKI